MDITDRKLAEEQRQRTDLIAAELAAIQKTTATYAHEINNPLAGIQGTLQLLLEFNKDDQDSNEMLNEALQATYRIRDVVAKLQAVEEVKYKPYLGDRQIIDLHSASVY